MHWTSILTALVLSLICAFLVAFQGWGTVNALLVVGGIAAVLIMGLIGALVLIAKPEDRVTLVREILTTMRDDLDDLLRQMRLRP